MSILGATAMKLYQRIMPATGTAAPTTDAPRNNTLAQLQQRYPHVILLGVLGRPVASGDLDAMLDSERHMMHQTPRDEWPQTAEMLWQSSSGGLIEDYVAAAARATRQQRTVLNNVLTGTLQQAGIGRINEYNPKQKTILIAGADAVPNPACAWNTYCKALRAMDRILFPVGIAASYIGPHSA